MKSTIRLATGVAALIAGFSGASASAQDSAWEVSGNVAYTSDYRFRGVSLSGNEFAIQGGIDAGHESGFYAGTWASSIDTFAGSETELDFYAGYGWEVEGLSFDVGAIGYFYPGSDDTEYYEAYGSVSGTAGIVGLTAGVAYAPEQDNLGEDDNLYVYGDAELPLGESPVSLALHIGVEDGAFGDEKVDYSVSLDKTVGPVDVSLAFIGTDQDEDDGFGDLADETVVFTISKSL